MEKKISVIVPIYNVEQYLRKCVDSIINQTYKNLEIILVDDGSPDNCPTICDEYAKKDKRVRVIHKKNGGLSDARNAGLEIVTCDFITFVDSDDWIKLDTYEIMMKAMNEYNADIVVSNINYVYDNKVNKKYNEGKIHVFNKEEAMNELIHDGLVQAVVWNKLYKKDLINDMKFKVGKINEDEFFTYKICAKAEKVVYMPNTLYQYRQRENSIMGSYSLKRLDSVDALYERLQFIKLKFPSLYKEEKIIFCNSCIYNYQMILRLNNTDNKISGISKLKKYRSSITFEFKEITSCCLKEQIKIVLSGISLDSYCKLKNKIGWN
ncbi:Undecaprenyl-phosphate 4-deoxy-4-formamido-L-arabinose transferase [Terrisporobacter petrolearius]|uniref:Undecaprenyl-phosphate 4-deoxy-4-formamido-L-arabinose transferase n=1 Tax=Terrisporobacter petrolearius TaxID=1460447 RepID=A0ABZ3FA38_9FIRM